ncbi:APC family permease [Litoribacter populi]|uniref:Na-K-Cl cotransporter n=1 Tax=Litoribacter populi TaxID=2598460 RepID=UPI0021D0BB8B|nr:Na-K-Cl cotransporter [Litoribacter populi]
MFIPSLLTMMGVIMYLRLGYIVGNVGLLGTLGIVTLATFIIFLSSLSIATIATNTPVKGGGAYFLISRSLGIEIGGAVGIPLYFAQAFSIAFYISGFSESMQAIFPGWDPRYVGMITIFLLGSLALFSTNATIKAQYFILAIIGFSLLSLVLGRPLEDTEIEMWSVPAVKSVGFWPLFALFFPAVTGIITGVNMSGDLKNPARSLPKGTFMTLGVSYLIYMGLPLILASRADAATLVADPLVMQRIAWWGGAIILGLWGASLSSAMGALLGAPRVLQALVNDRIFTKKLNILGKGAGKERIPRAGTVFTMALTMLAVYFLDLDMIAPILTMFFLTTYAVLNITAGIERFLRSPSFRPKFKIHWIFSLLGAVGCIAAMFLINPLATISAMVVISLIFLWLKRRRMEATWGDVTRGMYLTLIRYAIMRLSKDAHPKSWRPNVLVLSGSPNKRWRLIEFANDLTQANALFTVSTILPENSVGQDKVLKFEKQMSDYLQRRNVQALVRVIRAANPFTGAVQLVDAYGMGPLVPNTILLGDTKETKHHTPYAKMIDHFHQSKKNVLIVQDDDNRGFRHHRVIDIWWGGLKRNGSLMIILAYLLKNTPKWYRATVNIKMVVASEEGRVDAQKNLDELFSQMRTGFQYQILVAKNETFWEIQKRESANSDLVMMGLGFSRGGKGFEEYYSKLKENTSSLPTKVFVLAAQDIAFEEVLR